VNTLKKLKKITKTKDLCSYTFMEIARLEAKEFDNFISAEYVIQAMRQLLPRLFCNFVFKPFNKCLHEPRRKKTLNITVVLSKKKKESRR